MVTASATKGQSSKERASPPSSPRGLAGSEKGVDFPFLIFHFSFVIADSRVERELLDGK